MPTTEDLHLMIRSMVAGARNDACVLGSGNGGQCRLSSFRPLVDALDRQPMRDFAVDHQAHYQRNIGLDLTVSVLVLKSGRRASVSGSMTSGKPVFESSL